MWEGCSAWCRPILVLGIVEAKFYALIAALGRQLLQRITFERRRLDDIEGIGLGIEHGKAVMVLGCNYDVFHPRRLGQTYDLGSAELRRIEAWRQRLVVRHRNCGRIHDPLADPWYLFTIPAPCWNGIESPMDEHAETGFSEPLHPLAILSGRFSVLDGTHSMRAACLNMAALKLRPGLQRVAYHSPGCSQGAGLENASPGYLHAIPPV